MLLRLLDELASQEAIARLLGPEAARVERAVWDTALLEPVRNFLSRPGKCFRLRLARWCWKAAGGGDTGWENIGLLLEVIHAGSLIVDDIQDEALARRGSPALHRLYGIPLALNAGNWLYFWPTLIIENMALDAEAERTLHRLIGRTMWQCHGGQALDISLRVEDLAQAAIAPAVAANAALKTGALMGLAAAAPAAALGCSSYDAARFASFGRELGVGLQMMDDLSSVTREERAEKAREDLHHGTPTWPWVWAAARCTPPEFAAMQSLARRVREHESHYLLLRNALRDHVEQAGRAAMRRQVNKALAAAVPLARSARDADLLRREIERLEAAYG
jgi:geranylgeranyl pyrophosphate synthase